MINSSYLFNKIVKLHHYFSIYCTALGSPLWACVAAFWSIAHCSFCQRTDKANNNKKCPQTLKNGNFFWPNGMIILVFQLNWLNCIVYDNSLWGEKHVTFRFCFIYSFPMYAPINYHLKICVCAKDLCYFLNEFFFI